MSTALSDTDPTQNLSPEQMRSEQHWKEQFTKEELREILAMEDWRSVWTLLVNWGVIFASFALVGWRANPLTIVLALFLIGGRQLGCSIVLHEAAHRSFLSNRKWNDRIGNWFGAYPVWSEVLPYRNYHLVHHAKTGTEADPDLSLTLPFPISKKSFRRKVWRDLSGQTGWKQLAGTFKRDLGIGEFRNQRNQGLKPGEKPDVGWHKLVPVLVSNGVILGILALFARPELYLLWPIALLTTFRLVIRIRSIAEHAMTGPAEDPLRNTRTTLVSWWERLFLAPNFVNYHLEHHLLMTVPHYHLPKMHKLLRERGLLEKALINDGGYRDVLQRAASA
ncbi:MAG TPA: fatty acid desaturase [Myxococcales bacterium]|nr:fatty acid desaturase [Myxococcales bacterium]HIK85572.1 fatty acid desaturase [Myxococcales bacterium]